LEQSWDDVVINVIPSRFGSAFSKTPFVRLNYRVLHIILIPNFGTSGSGSINTSRIFICSKQIYDVIEIEVPSSREKKRFSRAIDCEANSKIEVLMKVCVESDKISIL
jgi:hypothetical protein